MLYTIKDGVPVYSSDAADPNNLTQAERNAVVAFVTADEQTQATTEAARLAKRPKRSEINALKSKVGVDNSVAELRATVDLLISMMDNVLAFQQVDIDEEA